MTPVTPSKDQNHCKILNLIREMSVDWPVQWDGKGVSFMAQLKMGVLRLQPALVPNQATECNCVKEVIFLCLA